MFELSLNNVKKYMDATLVLKNITFQVYSGEKAGIVGVNGSGKSTVLKLIAGIEKLYRYPGSTSLGYDEGWISMPKEATVAYLEQIPQYPEGLKVIDVLNLAFEEIYEIEKGMRQLEAGMKTLEGEELEKALKKYGELLQLCEVKGGYGIQEKLSKVCQGLKFDEGFLNRDFSRLSGGEKTTVVLGKILIDHPDILLLDEPTNHLDMESIEWLEEYLRDYKGIVIIVSHDRYFLDNVVDKIIEIEDMESETYKGNYTDYINQKEEKMLIQFDDFKEQQKKINAMEKNIKELRDWALRADNNKFFKRAASIQKRLDKLNRIDKPIFEKQNMKLNLKTAHRSGNETIKVKELAKSYGDKVIFKDANLLINFGERVGFIGPNGSGKTTFLKLLLGEEQPDKGVVELGANVMAAYLPQKITFNNEELTVLECFREDIFLLEGKAREYLSKFMFYGKSVFKKVKYLSGGEKIRLKLAQLLYEDVNLLILDEPTNHLDIDSIETLEEALEEFNGTIFFISHDRYFINKVCQRVVALEDNGFKGYTGNYDYYKNEKERQLEEVSPQEDAKESVQKTEKLKKTRNAGNADENKKKEIELAKAEKKIEDIEKQIAAIDIAMEAAGENYEELNKLYNQKGNLTTELEEVMELWLSFTN
ncbi:ribosomal protection-like ABC-F family protein [Alkaliphilus hydrothermalis]|uniref:ATPase subunit of ABC transporter with duplicated ATPase domains n=1 Tax=Alkaliphilus hydrothermalis TaxID=1482730 RepID=A0ABS2NT45_9FIRM|nr:ABC-F type ribosomal protection protein [Alkaliphilus hydrothermalis]MBM7616139.1 ATPase subunit of ABC transporter with duplicated ATPase domains [Alkaliphilus hydrothermalis]